MTEQTTKETMATLPNGWKVSQQVINLIADLDFEYDRMSRGGQETYDTICELLYIQDAPEED